MYMKYIFAVVVGLFVTIGVVEASSALIKGVEFARVGVGADAVVVSKVVDGNTTCYISRHGKFGAHGISCVK